MKPHAAGILPFSLFFFSIVSVFLVFTGWYVTSHYREFAIIFKIPWQNLAVLYFLFASILYLSAMFTGHITKAFGLRLSVFDCVMLSVATSAANYLTFFRGGAGVRALFLKDQHRFAYADFLSTLSAMYLLHLVVSGVMGLIGLWLLIYRGLSFDWPFAIFFATSSGICALILFNRIHMPSYDRFPLREIARVVNGWSLIKNDI